MEVHLSQLAVTLRPADTVADLPARWQALERRADATLFLTWHWIGTWLRESGLRPWLLQARDGERTVALALLQPGRRGILVLHGAGDADHDSITIEHNDLLLDRDGAERSRNACLRFLAGTEARRTLGWDELRVAGTSALPGYRAAAAAAGLSVAERARSGSWSVDLDGLRRSGAGFVDTLSANTRQQLRRSMRLYAKRGPLAAVAAKTVVEALDFLQAMAVLHQRTWTGRGRSGSFAHPFFGRFHRALVAEAFDAGAVELLCVRAGDQPIGFLYNLVWDGWVGAYQSGFLYEADPRLKPGLVSHALCIERHAASGAASYDMLAGDSRYKSSLASPGPEIGTLMLQRNLLRLRLMEAARRAKAALRDRRNA